MTLCCFPLKHVYFCCFFRGLCSLYLAVWVPGWYTGLGDGMAHLFAVSATKVQRVAELSDMFGALSRISLVIMQKD